MVKKYNNFLWGFIGASVVVILIGLLLVMKPALASATVGYIVGAAFLVSGIFALVKFFTNRSLVNIYAIELIYGVVNILLGICVMFNPLSLVSVLTISLGIYLLANGLVKIRYGVLLAKNKDEIFPLVIALGILVIAFGIVLIVNPFSGTFTAEKAIVQTVGVFTMASGFTDIIEAVLFKKRAKEMLKYFGVK